MLPLALVELLTESYLLFRRLLGTYNTFKRVKDFVELTDLTLNEDLRNHRTVIGEEAFLFLLGRHTLKSLNPQELWTESTMNHLALRALSSSLINRTSPDVRSCLIDYAAQLGQVTQLYDETFYDKCFKYLNANDAEYKLEDPFFKFFQEGAYTLSGELSSIIKTLGVSDKAWEAMMLALKNEDLSYLWTDPMDMYANVRPHKTQPFLGLVMRGAAAVRPLPLTGVPILAGKDSFDINVALIQRPQPFIPRREVLTDDRTITSEMVSMMSRRIMTLRGFVSTGINEWTHISEATWVPADDTNKTPAGYRRIKMEGAKIDLSSDDPLRQRKDDLVHDFSKQAVMSVFNALKKTKIPNLKGSKLPPVSTPKTNKP